MKAINLIPLFLLFIAPLKANDNALYGRVAPPNASFFRVVNLDAKPIAIQVSGQKEIKLAPYHISEYGYVSPGELSISIEGEDYLHNALEKGQVTIVWKGEGQAPISAIEEETFNNKRKARVKLYNLTDLDTLSLATADGKNMVISEVGANQAGTRDINAVKVQLGIFSDGLTNQGQEEFSFVRGKVTSVFAMQTDESISFVIQESER